MLCSICNFGGLLLATRTGETEETHQIEFSADLIANPSRCGGLAKDCLVHYDSWVEGPSRVASIEIHDSAKVVTKRNVNVKTTSNEASGLEEVVVVLRMGLLSYLGRQSILGFIETTVFVNGCELLYNVVVESSHLLEG